MSSVDLMRWLIELVVALGGGGIVAYLFTLRQRKQLLTAQASSAEDSGSAKIMAEAAKIVGNAADMVPQLLQRVTQLEATNELRETRYVAVRAELDEVHQWAGEAVRWMSNAVRIIVELGGQVDPPPPVPERRPFPRPTPSGR
jgi:hypothetical protein